MTTQALNALAFAPAHAQAKALAAGDTTAVALLERVLQRGLWHKQ